MTAIANASFKCMHHFVTNGFVAMGRVSSIGAPEPNAIPLAINAQSYSCATNGVRRIAEKQSQVTDGIGSIGDDHVALRYVGCLPAHVAVSKRPEADIALVSVERLLAEDVVQGTYNAAGCLLHMRIDHGGLKVSMSEQQPDGPNVSSGGEQMSGEGV
jgi:hypothetical protein